MSSAQRDTFHSIEGDSWSFSDADTTEASAHSGHCDELHWTCEQVEPSAFRGHLTKLRIGRLNVTRESTNQPLKYHGAQHSGSLIFHTALPSSSRMYFCGQAIEHDDLIVLPGKAIEYGYISGPFNILFVTVDEETFADCQQQMYGNVLPLDSLGLGRAISDPVVVEKFRHSIEEVLNELIVNSQALEECEYRESVAKRIMKQLVEAVYHDAPQACELPRPSTRVYIVEKAIKYIDSNLEESISIADLCRVVRVSRRTLSYSFEEILGVSPARYLLTARLKRVHQELIELGDRRSINYVAYSNGFTHMGRFAKNYRQAFGELPSETCIYAKAQRRGRPSGSFSGHSKLAI